MTKLHNLAHVGYLSGPVDACKVYDATQEGDHTLLFGSSYLSLWFGLLRHHGLKGTVVTSLGDKTSSDTRHEFSIFNRPKTRASGLQYHWDMARWVFGRLSELHRRGARVVVMTDAQDYWFVTPVFRLRGMRFVNSYHCALRPLALPWKSPRRLCIRLTSWLHLAFADPCIGVSPRIIDQLSKEPGTRRFSAVFRPHYGRADFAECTRKPERSPRAAFDVLFAGRVEANKGVFDLLAACQALSRRDGPTVRFHIHGEGGAVEALRTAARDAGLEDRFILYGFTSGKGLAAHYAACDAVIVPTRSDFEEGFAKSVIEGVLALRPVITSQACPAIDVVADACVEADVDDAQSYADCIWALANQPALLNEKVDAAERLRDLFFDPPDSYAARLTEALAVVAQRPFR